MKLKLASIVLLLHVMLALPGAYAQSHEHGHHEHGHHDHGGSGAATEPVERPRVFLDKNPRIVRYQLDRLSNERLLLVERGTDDLKYAPVYLAILTRAGMSAQHRHEALEGMVELHRSDAVTELLEALKSLDDEERQQRRVGRQLAEMLVAQPHDLLSARLDELKRATEAEQSNVRTAGYAALLAAGQLDVAWSLAQRDDTARKDFLSAVPLVPGAERRGALREPVVELLSAKHPVAVRRAAIEALAAIPSQQQASFRLLAPLVEHVGLKTAAVRTLLRTPAEFRESATSEQLLSLLVDQAENTAPDKRTTDEFIDSMQLADQLLARVPVERVRSYRERLRDVAVRVVRIRTVEEEMRYDTPYFAVEAGRPVQLILQNDDLMPHNLVVTLPGKLREVAEEGAKLTPDAVAAGGMQYVPDMPEVLQATDMVQAGQQFRLTFTAPEEPGEYPYVCTFPRHWMRMYGVMVVVEDLDVWLKNPTEPADPIGSNRSFVQSWTLQDLADDVPAGLRGRSPQIGQQMFTEATCAQCHKVKGQGGAVGPELTGVLERYKGEHAAVLREILDPSHKIDPKYAVHVVVTTSGQVLSGIITAEDKRSVSILSNPENPQPTVIARSDIDEIVPSSKSMMPKALLDRFTKDEILELLAYVVAE